MASLFTRAAALFSNHPSEPRRLSDDTIDWLNTPIIEPNYEVIEQFRQDCRDACPEEEQYRKFCMGAHPECRPFERYLDVMPDPRTWFVLSYYGNHVELYFVYKDWMEKNVRQKAFELEALGEHKKAQDMHLQYNLFEAISQLTWHTGHIGHGSDFLLIYKQWDMPFCDLALFWRGMLEQGLQNDPSLKAFEFLGNRPKWSDTGYRDLAKYWINGGFMDPEFFGGALNAVPGQEVLTYVIRHEKYQDPESSLSNDGTVYELTEGLRGPPVPRMTYIEWPQEIIGDLSKDPSTIQDVDTYPMCFMPQEGMKDKLREGNTVHFDHLQCAKLMTQAVVQSTKEAGDRSVVVFMQEGVAYQRGGPVLVPIPRAQLPMMSKFPEDFTYMTTKYPEVRVVPQPQLSDPTTTSTTTAKPTYTFRSNGNVPRSAKGKTYKEILAEMAKNADIAKNTTTTTTTTTSTTTTNTTTTTTTTTTTSTTTTTTSTTTTTTPYELVDSSGEMSKTAKVGTILGTLLGVILLVTAGVVGISLTITR